MAARADRLTAMLLLAFAGYTIAEGVRMGYWQGRIPGPGFAPIWIGAGLALAALLLLLRRAPPAAIGTERSTDSRGDAVREKVLVFEIAGVTIVAAALIPRAGMMAAVGLLLLALVKVLRGSWRAALGAAIVLPVAFYLVFVRWLQVPIPKGPWGF